MRVQRPTDFTLTVERSRFHARLLPLGSVDDIEGVIRRRRGEFRKANHHCWALRLIGPDGRPVERSRDDGEVGHPGRVLLELLRRHDLEGALVVSRIFGGVKLGIGGVSRAFREAGQGAVAAGLPERAAGPQRQRD